MNSKVTVIIPFYQKTRGLLHNAVTSVLNQKTRAILEIVVVDDGSLVSARSELADILREHPDKIILIEQSNAGCPSASNAGLDAVSRDTDFIAFLDSDDTWTDSHIEHAVWALENGYDFYFSDFYQLGQTVTAFKRGGRIQVENHCRIHPSEPIYEYDGDMINQVIVGNILGVSTLVYDFRKFADLRYSTQFHHTGMEYIFFVNLASRSKRIAFSSSPECRYGPGVNIFSDMGWGTEKYLNIIYDDIKFRKYMLKEIRLTNVQKTSLRNRIRQLRIDYGQGLMHNVLHNRGITAGNLWKQIRLDPQTFFALPLICGKAVYKRFHRSV